MENRIGNYKSISAAAKAAGVDRQNLWKMLNGKERISLDMCFRFCRAWDMSLSEIIHLFYPAEYEENKRYIERVSAESVKVFFDDYFQEKNA